MPVLLAIRLRPSSLHRAGSALRDGYRGLVGTVLAVPGVVYFVGQPSGPTGAAVGGPAEDDAGVSRKSAHRSPPPAGREAPAAWSVQLAASRQRGVQDEPAVAAEQILALGRIVEQTRQADPRALRAGQGGDRPGGGSAQAARGRSRRLRWSALLHDIGKLTVAGSILNKPGRPDENEWRILQGHPLEGARLAAPLASWLGPWADTIAQHHEKYDGTGYPYGLSGDQISLGGRIVAVADCYETMTAVRSYKSAMTAEAARKELAACAGGHFDPVIVRAFLEASVGRANLLGGPLSWLGELPLINGLPRLGQLATTAGHAFVGALALAGVSVAAVNGAHHAHVTPAPVVAVGDPPDSAPVGPPRLPLGPRAPRPQHGPFPQSSGPTVHSRPGVDAHVCTPDHSFPTGPGRATDPPAARPSPRPRCLRPRCRSTAWPVTARSSCRGPRRPRTAATRSPPTASPPTSACVAQPVTTFTSALTTETITGLTDGTAYTFTVAAITDAGTGPDSSPSAPITPAALPSAPLAVNGVAGDGQVVLSWTPPAQDGGDPITGYRVTPYIGSVAQPATTFTSAATTETITGLTDGTAYTFTVAAITDAGTGPASSPSAPITPAALPSAPLGVNGVAGDGQVALSWTPPAQTAATRSPRTASPLTSARRPGRDHLHLGAQPPRRSPG